MLPATLLREAARFRRRTVVWYVDNTAAEGALKKGYSGSRFMTAIVAEFWDICIRNNIAVWIDRVPSKENIADAPSRGDIKYLVEELKASQRKPVIGDPANY